MPYLSLEDVQGKAIEAADNGLLHIKTKGFDRLHGRKHKTGPARAQHVDVDGPAFPEPNLNLLQAKGDKKGYHVTSRSEFPD